MSTSIVPRTSAREVARRIAADRPMFHLADRTTSYITRGQPVTWNALAETLDFIASQVDPGHRTLEIGAGSTSVVFAAAGAVHTAISPVAYEHERIAEYAEEIGVPMGDTRFVAD